VTGLLRRLPLSRLLLLCGVAFAVGIGATALALAVGSGPTPPPKPLADALHDALGAPKADGVSARIQLTNRLLEGANLAGSGGEAGQLSAGPLISGASGRLWAGADGHARLELQSEKGDTQILWDGKTAEMYDASTNTLYRYTPERESGEEGAGACPQGPAGGSCATHGEGGATPSVAEIEEHIARASKHAQISGATPTDVAGQAAYTVRVSPRENGGLIGGAEVSWDATHGNPLRAAIYSTNSSAPVVELATTEISYGSPDNSALEFTPPADAKVKDVTLPRQSGTSSSSTDGEKPHLTVHGKGLGAIVLAESPLKAGGKESLPSQLEGLQQVDVNGTKASELPTQLGTLLSFERAGVRYLLAGSVTPSSIETFARGL
jgi:outer membrane lipoprotein-sorting protein